MKNDHWSYKIIDSRFCFNTNSCTIVRLTLNMGFISCNQENEQLKAKDKYMMRYTMVPGLIIVYVLRQVAFMAYGMMFETLVLIKAEHANNCRATEHTNNDVRKF